VPPGRLPVAACAGIARATVVTSAVPTVIMGLMLCVRRS
jgi:hypothetical protein